MNELGGQTGRFAEGEFQIWGDDHISTVEDARSLKWRQSFEESTGLLLWSVSYIGWMCEGLRVPRKSTTLGILINPTIKWLIVILKSYDVMTERKSSRITFFRVKHLKSTIYIGGKCILTHSAFCFHWSKAEIIIIFNLWNYCDDSKNRT